MKLRVAGPGWPLILAGAAAGSAGAAALLVAGKASAWTPAGAALFLLGWLFAGFCAFFFRDPDRPLPGDPGKLYSPGDGRVLSVGREGPGDIVTIRIFLSLFDVHVQRAPCAGIVDRVQYQPGKFAMAMKDEARSNERNIVRIAPDGGRPKVVVEQIAGFVARRIDCWVKEGDRVEAGGRYGMIRFGSQAAVHLPARARPLVRPGDTVRGGLTEIAEWTS